MTGRLLPIPAAAVTGATALALIGLTACSTSDTAAASREDGGKVDVVASFYPMQYLADEIGRDHVSVTTLTEPASNRTTWNSPRSRPPSSATATSSSTSRASSPPSTRPSSSPA